MRANSDDTYFDQYSRVCYADGPFTGEVETRGAEGQLIELSSYYEGIEHGPQQEWHENGQLKEKGVTKMGVAVGQWWSWYSDGKPARQLVFDDNGWQISRKRWDEAGNVIEDN